MNPIRQILEAHNISQETVIELFQSFKTNPMAGLAKVQELGLPPEKLQEMMGILMSSPTIFEDTIRDYGLDVNEVMEAQKKASGGM